MQHAKGRTGDRPGPRKGATTGRNVTQGVVPPPPSSAIGRSCILDSHPRAGDARSSADARSSTDACLSSQKVQGREANRRRHRPTEPTTKALCQTPPLLPQCTAILMLPWGRVGYGRVQAPRTKPLHPRRNSGPWHVCPGGSPHDAQKENGPVGGVQDHTSAQKMGHEDATSRLFTGVYMVFGPRLPHCISWRKFSPKMASISLEFASKNTHNSRYPGYLHLHLICKALESPN